MEATLTNQQPALGVLGLWALRSPDGRRTLVFQPTLYPTSRLCCPPRFLLQPAANASSCELCAHYEPGSHAIDYGSPLDDFLEISSPLGVPCDMLASVTASQPLVADILGILGVLHTEGDVFVAFVSGARPAAELEGTTVMQVTRVNFISISTDRYDDRFATCLSPSGLPPPMLPPDDNDAESISSQNSAYSVASMSSSTLASQTPGSLPPNDPSAATPCAAIARLLRSGSFYFCPTAIPANQEVSSGASSPPIVTLDLSRSAQSRYTQPAAGPDPNYIWNIHLLKPILHVFTSFANLNSDAANSDLDNDIHMGGELGPLMQRAIRSGFLLLLIQGYVGLIRQQPPLGLAVVDNDDGNTSPVSVALLSRVSCQRAGTRYYTRGIDDAGAVANFVETETLVYTATNVFSYAQVRGSVPIFWEQQGLQVVGHKIQLTRSCDATLPAFMRHFGTLASTYYGAVTAISLVSQGAGSGGEAILSAAYRRLFAHLQRESPHVLYNFDFHVAVKGGNYGALSVHAGTGAGGLIFNV